MFIVGIYRYDTGPRRRHLPIYDCTEEEEEEKNKKNNTGVLIFY